MAGGCCCYSSAGLQATYLLIRSCLIFGLTGHLIVTGLAFNTNSLFPTEEIDVNLSRREIPISGEADTLRRSRIPPYASSGDESRD